MRRGVLPCDVVIFDLGNVVFPISFRPVLEHWAGLSGQEAEDLRGRLHGMPHHDRFERGELSPAEYRSAVNEALGVAMSDEDFDRGWNAIFHPCHPGIGETLAELRVERRLVALTNTNAIHQARYESLYADVLVHFERIFASHEMGMRKPEQRIYQTVLAELAVPERRALFIDDRPENVAAARAVGLDAFQAASPEEIQAGLRARGL